MTQTDLHDIGGARIDMFHGYNQDDLNVNELFLTSVTQSDMFVIGGFEMGSSIMHLAYSNNSG